MKLSRLLGSWWIPSANSFILSEFSPILFFESRSSKCCKFMGSYYRPTINSFILSVF